MLSCRDLAEIATEFTEGKLPFRRRVELHLHMAMCRGCRRFVDQLRTTTVMLGRMPAPEVSPKAQEELTGKYAEWTVAGDGDSATRPRTNQ